MSLKSLFLIVYIHGFNTLSVIIIVTAARSSVAFRREPQSIQKRLMYVAAVMRTQLTIDMTVTRQNDLVDLAVFLYFCTILSALLQHQNKVKFTHNEILLIFNTDICIFGNAPKHSDNLQKLSYGPPLPTAAKT